MTGPLPSPAGMWPGCGFLQGDGCRSGVATAASLGCGMVSEDFVVPTLYVADVTHSRRSPLVHHFRYAATCPSLHASESGGSRRRGELRGGFAACGRRTMGTYGPS